MFLFSGSSNPLGSRAKWMAARAGHSCGEGCAIYDSNRGAPVVTEIDPAGRHVYPHYASEMIVEFLKQHSRAAIGSHTPAAGHTAAGTAR